MIIFDGRTWLPEDYAKLRKLAAQGLRSDEIADVMGRTRLAITAKMSKKKIKSSFIAAQKWTPERDDELKQMVDAGKTMAQIAEAMGTTRNAIIGRKNRLGIKSLFPNQHNVGRNPLTREEKAARSRAQWEEWSKRKGPVGETTDTRRRKAERREVAGKTMRAHIVCCESPKLIWDLKWCDCRWLVTHEDLPDNKFYCSNVVEPGKSYCAAHQKMATEYVPGGMTQYSLPVRKGAITIHH